MKKHKNIVIFLIKFFATYFILFAVYNTYLQSSQLKKTEYKTASITTKVADQTIGALELAGYHADAIQHEKELSVKILIENKYVARVIEGCNSISIIILFISFVVAFPGSLKATILFSLFGGFLIYLVNILRIAFLSVMLFKFPEEQILLHNIIFPAIIYGLTFILWVIWVQKFSNHKKNG